MSTQTPTPNSSETSGLFKLLAGAFKNPQNVTPVNFGIVADQNAKGEEPLTKKHGSLTAAAQRITQTQIKGGREKPKGVSAREWQVEAWEMYNEVGEQHFLTSVLAGQIGKANLYVGKSPEGAHAGGEPVPTEDDNLQALLDPLGAGPASSSQFKRRIALNLLITGEAWLVGIPPRLYPASPQFREEQSQGMITSLFNPLANEPEDYVDDFIWRVLSVSEMTFEREKVTLQLPDNGGEKIEVDLDSIHLIRIWQQHPEKAWEPDSATRAVLPVLRELVGLTMHVSAQVDSRLAGAGLLIVPQSVQETLKQRQQAYEDANGLDDGDGEDLFMNDLIEAMVTPIKDRSSASAVVPLTVTAPDEVTDKFNYLSFSTSLDEEAKTLREEAIRRLALGQDAPPEILLGTGGMNHWGAWLVQEETVNTHVTPHLAVICEALTEQYLRPILIAQGMSEDEAEEYSVWYDVSHMITRPNRGRDALALYQAGEISGSALREASGFPETSAPGYDPESRTLETENTRDRAVKAALDLISRNGSVLRERTLGELVDEIEAAMEGKTIPNPAAGGEATVSGDIPDTDADPAEPSEGV